MTDLTGKAVIWACGDYRYEERGSYNKKWYARAKLRGIHFFSCYAPPSLEFDQFTDFLNELVDDIRDHAPAAIAVDFNAWAVDWGSKKNNGRGIALLDVMSTLDAVLHNIGSEPTYEKNGKSSIADLTFVSSSLTAENNNAWRVTETYTGSDHRPLTWNLPTEREMGQTNRGKVNARGWEVIAFDAEQFKTALDVRPIRSGNATEIAEHIMKRVAHASDATMPRKRFANKRPPVYWWNENIATIRRECIAARRTEQRGRGKPNHETVKEAYRKARLELVKAIKASKRQCWDELLEEVDSDPWGRPYKAVITRLKRQDMPSPTCPKLLKKIVETLR